MIHVKKFRINSTPVLPAEYGDSLSYGEIQGKIIDKLNELIDSVNDLEQRVTELEGRINND